MSENRFTPKLKDYKDIGQFRFWCQKVLPLVYDDSLSYYELLCKVVNYLNDVIANSSVEEENIAMLLIAFKELEDFVISEIDPSVFVSIYERLDTLEGKINALEQLQIAQKFRALDEKDAELMRLYTELKELVDSFDFLNWKVVVEDKLAELYEEDGKLWEAYNELKDYLDNINWTELVSDKIDELVREGILTGIEIATAERLGGIKIGNTLKIDSQTGVADINLISNRAEFEAVSETGFSVVEAFLVKQLLQEGAKEYTELRIYTEEEDLYGKEVKAVLIENVEGITEEVTGEFDDNGYCNIRVYNIGTYSVSCTDEEGTWTQNVVIDSFTIAVVNITKFRATIALNFGGGADVTGQTIVVKAEGSGKSYSKTIVGSTGTINVGMANTGYTITASIDDGVGVAHSNSVTVSVEGEGQYSAPIMSFARIEIEAEFETNANATLSKGTTSYSYSFTQSGQKIGEFVDLGDWALVSEVDGESGSSIIKVDDYAVYNTIISAKYVTLTISTDESALQSATVSIYKGSSQSGTFIGNIELENGFGNIKIYSSVLGSLPSDVFVYYSNDVNVIVNFNSWGETKNAELFLTSLLTPELGMTDYSTPTGYGTVSASSEYNIQYLAWRAFGFDSGQFWSNKTKTSTLEWLQFEFNTAKCVTGFEIAKAQNVAFKATLVGSNDGINWSSPFISFNSDDTEISIPTRFNFDNNTYYKYYRFNFTNITSYISISKIKFYGK